MKKRRFFLSLLRKQNTILKPNLLLNENIGIKVANFLRNKNYNTKSAIEDFKGVSDKELLEIASQEERLIVTLDTDFCKLIFRDSLPCCGVILLRLKNESPDNISKILISFLENVKEDLKDKFVVITEARARIKSIR